MHPAVAGLSDQNHVCKPSLGLNPPLSLANAGRNCQRAWASFLVLPSGVPGMLPFLPGPLRSKGGVNHARKFMTTAGQDKVTSWRCSFCFCERAWKIRYWRDLFLKPRETCLCQSGKIKYVIFDFSFCVALSHTSGYSCCSWTLWLGDLPNVYRPPPGGELMPSRLVYPTRLSILMNSY